MNPNVDVYFNAECGRCSHYNTPQCKVHTWQDELQALRMIVLECPLVEERKWGVPCYTFNDKNLILLGAFKDNCVISFLNGALLKDEHKILVKPGENSRVGRIIRFTNVQDIINLAPQIKAYIMEAIEYEKAGIKVDLSQDNDLNLPEEFIQILEEYPELNKAFYALTPGRQRGYQIYFSGAKQSKTRISRIEKYAQKNPGRKRFPRLISVTNAQPNCNFLPLFMLRTLIH